MDFIYLKKTLKFVDQVIYSVLDSLVTWYLK